MKVVATTGGRGTRRSRVRLTPAAVALAVAAVVLLFALAVPVRTLMQQRSDLAHIQAEQQALERRNAALKLQVARLHDPAYLERVARECLGMVRPGEISFVVVPKGGSGGADATDPPPTKGSQGTC
jgi:cell division protein FtsL